MYIFLQCLFQGKKIQKTILHECVVYFLDDFQENNWYSKKDLKIKTNVEPGQQVTYLNSNSVYPP